MNDRVPNKLTLNRYGLIILGAALYEHQIKLEQQVEYQSSEKILDNSKLTPFAPLKDKTKKIRALKNSIKKNIDALGAKLCDEVMGRSAMFSTFRFDWWHLYNHKVLTAYCNPNLKSWTGVSKTYETNTIIADMPFQGTAHEALQMIFFKESNYLLDYGNMEDEDNVYAEYYEHHHVKSPRGSEEIFFILMVSDFCNPRKNIYEGKSEGSGRNELVMQEVVPLARQLHSDGLSKNGAAKSALERLNIPIIPFKPNEDKKPSVFYASTKQSALNIIAKAMGDGERY